MVSLFSTYQWLITPERFKWTIITSVDMLDLTQYGVRTELVSRAPGFHQGLFGPNKFWTALKSSACFLAKKERCFFRRTTEVLDHNEICILHPYVDLIA